MSSANVLPSAPAYGVSAEVPKEHDETQTLYPLLPMQPNNFRLQKANEVLKYLSEEVDNYRLVAKKYKRTKTIINYSSFVAGGVSGALLAGGGGGGGVGSAITGIGIPAAVPIGIVAAKKLEPKLIKHCKIMTLAMSKLDTVNRILSKSLVDGKITDAEFQSVLNEKEGYRIQKEIVRKGVILQQVKNNFYYITRSCQSLQLKQCLLRSMLFFASYQRTFFSFLVERDKANNIIFYITQYNLILTFPLLNRQRFLLF